MQTEVTEDPETEQSETQESEKTAGQLRREHYDQTIALGHEADALESAYEQLNDEAKAAKKVWEAAVNRLRAHIRRGPECLPLFDAEDEAFLDTAVEFVLTVTEKQLEKLHDVGVKTVREFESLRAGQIDGCPDGIRSIKGFSDAKVDLWEEEILDWLKKHQPEAEE